MMGNMRTVGGKMHSHNGSYIDELNAIITSKSTSLQARLPFKHGHNVAYSRSSFIFIM